MIRCAVIGVGYLGRFHAQKYHLLDNVELVAVCDVNPTTASAVGQELDVPYVVDYRALFGKVDAVSIATTTKQHYHVAKNCLKQGIHVLLEKPMTETIEQATALISLAQQYNCKFQIGHMERFNAARLALDNHLDNPLFIESHRLAPYKPRGVDVNVVLDLMIHDIDIIQSIVNSPIINIDAQGAPVLSPSIDIANARIRFENNCIANVTASRISYKSERKTRIFQPNTYISIDFQNKKFAVFEKGVEEMFPGTPEIIRHESTFEDGDALLEQIYSFVDCIYHDKKTLVSGEEGRAALETADKITRFINQELRLREQKEYA